MEVENVERGAAGQTRAQLDRYPQWSHVKSVSMPLSNKIVDQTKEKFKNARWTRPLCRASTDDSSSVCRLLQRPTHLSTRRNSALPRSCRPRPNRTATRAATRASGDLRRAGLEVQHEQPVFSPLAHEEYAAGPSYPCARPVLHQARNENGVCW